MDCEHEGVSAAVISDSEQSPALEFCKYVFDVTAFCVEIPAIKEF